MSDPLVQKYILVVDDDSTLQMLLQGMIEKTGNKAVIAENGEKALQFLEVGGSNIAAILLDRNMPDMDGIEVVKAVMGDKRFERIPIIMQSGSTDPQQIKEAFDQGVFYYLSKPFKVEALQHVIDLAINKSDLSEILSERVDRGYTPINLIRSASFEFRTHEEAKSLAILLASFFPRSQKVMRGMTALLLNAVEHGTLGLGMERKSELMNTGQFIDEIKRLEKIKSNQNKIVEVQFIHKDDRIAVRITDQGAGFEWRKMIVFNEERASFTNGYGILKALNSFDEVKYNTAGNQVMATVFSSET